MSFKSLLIGIVMVATGSAVPACAAEYLTNGSFETGDFAGWTAAGDQSFVSVQPSSFPYIGGGVTQGAQDGNFYVYEGPLGSNSSLSQTFFDIAGQTLTISGWVTGAGPGQVDCSLISCSSNVSFLFNGTPLLGGVVDPVPDQIWTQYVFTTHATGSLLGDTFTVSFRDDPSFDGLDNFSVRSISAIPEPATWILLLLGFATVGFFRYRARDASKGILTA